MQNLRTTNAANNNKTQSQRQHNCSRDATQRFTNTTQRLASPSHYHLHQWRISLLTITIDQTFAQELCGGRGVSLLLSAPFAPFFRLFFVFCCLHRPLSPYYFITPLHYTPYHTPHLSSLFTRSPPSLSCVLARSRVTCASVRFGRIARFCCFVSFFCSVSPFDRMIR